MTGDAWDPRTYDRFAAEREAPFYDLLGKLVPIHAEPRILDLGSGTGRLTRILHERLGARRTLGIDASARMLAAAPEGVPGLSFVRSRIEDHPLHDEGGAPFDLLFSNAALHWCHGHAALFPKLVGALAPGGTLAVQMPANDDYVTHTVARELAREEPYAALLPPETREVLPAEAYALLLSKLGLDVDVTLKVYVHKLDRPLDVIAWTEGTLLTTYAERLPPAAYSDFRSEYERRVLSRLPDETPFFYPFRRLFVVAVRRGVTGAATAR